MTATLPRGRMPVPRVRAALLVALATVLAVPIVSSTAQVRRACNVTNQIVGSSLLWESIAAPKFDVGPATMSAFAVQPTDPDVLYVTNGKAVMRSSDAGCHWDEVLELTPNGSGDVAMSSLTHTITAITLPQRGAKRRVLLSVVEVEQGLGRPHIVRSESGDANSYEIADEGLPLVGRPTDLRIAPSDDRVVLVALRAVPSLNETPVGPVPPVGGPAPTQSGPVGALYRSNDGGNTWALAAEGAELGGAQVIDDIAISDLAAEKVWLIADGVLFSSNDAGSSFTDRGLTQAQQDAAGYRFTTLDVYQNRVFAFSRTTNAGTPAALRSNDGGASYKPSTVSFVVESAAHGRNVDDVIVGTPIANGSADLFQLSRGRWTSKAPVNNTSATWRVQIDRVRFIRFGLTPERLFRTTADQNPPKLGDPPVRVDGDLDGLAGIKPATLLPRSQTVALAPGQSREITYTLRVPKRPTPLDVYIVLDNSGSMTAFIDDLRLNLATAINRLRAGAVDVHVGLGYYKSLTSPPLYDRLVDVGPVNQAFFNALATLDPKSTKGNQEPILDALYQSATGEGRDNIEFQVLSTCDIDPGLPGCQIPRNKQANFRRDSLRVLLHAGNEEWDRNLPGSPSFEKTAEALRAKAIKHVGLAVLQIAKRDMADMAKATGAVAPPGGVDCTGDGVVDVPAGAGLVCPGTGDLAKTLVQVLNAVSDVQDLRFYSRGTSPVLRDLQPTTITPINVKADSTVSLRALVSCRGVEAGSYELRFGASLKESTIAEATALVTCGVPPAVAGVVPQIAPPQQQPPGQPPPGPAPIPAPAPQINPAPQSQPQIQAQANAQTGTAYEEQEQIQIATVGVDVRREGAEELAMSSLPLQERPDPLAAASVVLAGGGLMASACMGVVLARRRRTALATVRADHR